LGESGREEGEREESALAERERESEREKRTTLDALYPK
jgi:hypothetical protein